MKGSRFGTWRNNLTTFIPTSDPPQIVGNRRLPGFTQRDVCYLASS
jgi:hypothetical protein